MKKNHYSFFNVGTGNGTTVLELVNTFEKVNKIKLNYSLGGRRDGDITEAFADCSKIYSELKWKANLTLEEALESAWKWEKNLNSKD